MKQMILAGALALATTAFSVVGLAQVKPESFTTETKEVPPSGTCPVGDTKQRFFFDNNGNGTFDRGDHKLFLQIICRAGVSYSSKSLGFFELDGEEARGFSGPVRLKADMKDGIHHIIVVDGINGTLPSQKMYFSGTGCSGFVYSDSGRGSLIPWKFDGGTYLWLEKTSTFVKDFAPKSVLEGTKCRVASADDIGNRTQYILSAYHMPFNEFDSFYTRGGLFVIPNWNAW